MSLLSDQAVNPLARLTEGTHPPNSRRRRRAWLAVSLPSVLYFLFFFAFLFAFFLRINPMPIFFAPVSWLNPLYREELLESVMLSLMLGLFCVLAVSIIHRSSQLRPARKLRENWADYHLAGLTGRQMLRGLSGPAIVGFFSVAAVHLALYAVCMFLYALYIEFDEDFWAILVIGLAPAFALILFPLLDVALWALKPASLERLVASTAIAIATSPTVVLISFGIITGNLSLGYGSAVAEVVSWPFRLLIVRRIWLKAVRHLDTAPPPCFERSQQLEKPGP